MEAELSPETDQRRLVALGLYVLGELRPPWEHQVEDDLLDGPEDVHDLGDLDLAAGERSLDGGHRIDVTGLADRATSEHEDLARPFGDIGWDFLDALKMGLFAELDAAVDPLDQAAESGTLDHLPAVSAASGMHLFSGAPDEKPRVNCLTTLQYHGFSYHDAKPTGCGH
jgi:hypothetical protein